MENKNTDIYSGSLKKWLKYIIYAIVIFTYITIYSVLDAQSPHVPYMRIIVQTSGSIIFGIILGLEYLLNERKKEGKWSFNIHRFILVGIPSFISAMYYFFYYCPIFIVIPFRLPNLIFTNTFFIFSGILFGYVLITDFSKRKPAN